MGCSQNTTCCRKEKVVKDTKHEEPGVRMLIQRTAMNQQPQKRVPSPIKHNHPQRDKRQPINALNVANCTHIKGAYDNQIAEQCKKCKKRDKQVITQQAGLKIFINCPAVLHVIMIE